MGLLNSRAIIGLTAIFLALYVGFHYLTGPSASYYAAGVFPVAYDVETQRTFGLMGIDEHTGEWADFGGFRENREVDPIVTACREFVEETIGSFIRQSDRYVF